MKKGIFIVVYLCFYMEFMRILCRKLVINLLQVILNEVKDLETLKDDVTTIREFDKFLFELKYK